MNEYTDYQMQLVLEQLGYQLYFPEIDNQVDNELLSKLAVYNGYVWDQEKELWIGK